jgi:hypothetical protein
MTTDTFDCPKCESGCECTCQCWCHTGSQPKIDIVPTTLPIANRVVDAIHRHHAPIPGGFSWFCVAAVVSGQVVGVAIAGRPTNRNNDDGQTVEVLRLATDGTPNACSALLGSCARAAKAIGAARIITYTLDNEGGASLRGAGWDSEGGGKQSWWTHTGTRTAAVDRPHMHQKKTRWAKRFRPPIEVSMPKDETAEDPQVKLL